MEQIHVPRLGPEPWNGVLTKFILDQIVLGLLIPSQALSKRLAVELLKSSGEK